MPNWCENKVEIEGPAEAMNYFLDTYCERDPENENLCRICFGKVIPIEQMPDEEGQIKGFAQVQHQTERWGCKWDTDGDFRLDIHKVHRTATGEDGESIDAPEEIVICGYMDTPWGPPEQVVARIREMFCNDPKLNDPKLAGCFMNEWFYKEPGCELAGWL